MAWIERSHLSRELWRYGEDDLWRRVLTVSPSTMAAIGERADAYMYGDRSTDVTLVDQAFALAAVEVLEGAARPLRRERRRPEKDFPGLPRLRGLLAERWFDRDATRARKRVARAGVASRKP